MDINQPTTNYAPRSAAPGMFGTKIPSSVAFIVAILLFLLPLTEIKCGGSTAATKSGLNFVLSQEWKGATMMGKDVTKDLLEKLAGQKEGNASYFAIGAIALAILGFAISFGGKTKSAAGGAMICGILSAGCLIALMFEVKKWFNGLLAREAADKIKEKTDSFNLDMDTGKLSLGFTPWFYISVIALLAAAVFCYMRMRASKTS